MRIAASKRRSEKLKNVVQEISDTLKHHPDMSRHEAIEKAIIRHDLSPLDGEFIYDILIKK